MTIETKDIALLLIGIPIGIVCSFAAWWIVFRVIVPRVRFSESISKSVSNSSSGFSYRVKFGNYASREMIDVTVQIRYRVKGIGKRKNNTQNYTIATTFRPIPMVGRGGEGRIVRILPERTDAFLNPSFPEWFRDKRRDRTLLLEDLMVIGTEPSIQVHVFGYDGFSGSRKLFSSKRYGLDDIKSGKFKQLAVVPE